MISRLLDFSECRAKQSLLGTHARPNGRLLPGVLILIIASALYQAQFASAQNCEADWVSAQALADGGQYAEAAVAYQQILTTCPGSQRAAVLVGINQFEAGMYDDALTSIDNSIAIDPFSRVWAEWGYLHKAKICRELGCAIDARNAISTLRVRFPDSISTARAEIVEADLDGRDPTGAEDNVDEEVAAELLHEQAIDALRGGDRQVAESLFDQVIANFSGTRKSLRSLEIKGLMLGQQLPARTNDAIESFQQIIDRVALETPHARIRYESELRLGYLKLSDERQAEALQHFQWLAQNAQYPELAAEARLQAVGAQFEVYQSNMRAGQTVLPREWQDLRSLIEQIESNHPVTEEQLARYEIMYIETYTWESDWDSVLPLAESFIQEFPEPEFRSERALAQKMAAKCLRDAGRYDEALAYLNEIVQDRENGSYWPSATRFDVDTDYLIFTCLRRSDAPARSVQNAGRTVLQLYADTPHAAVVRRIANQEGWNDVD